MTTIDFKKIVVYAENSKFKLLWQKLAKNKYYRALFGAIIGAVIGLLYWNFIGCTGGTCPLTSDPYTTVILFTFLGIMFTRKNRHSN